MDSAEAKVAANVRRLRLSQGLSQEMLSHEAGLTVRHLGRIERGEVSPTVAMLAKVAKALKTDIADLFA